MTSPQRETVKVSHNPFGIFDLRLSSVHLLDRLGVSERMHHQQIGTGRIEWWVAR